MEQHQGFGFGRPTFFLESSKFAVQDVQEKRNVNTSKPDLAWAQAHGLGGHLAEALKGKLKLRLFLLRRDHRFGNSTTWQVTKSWSLLTSRPGSWQKASNTKACKTHEIVHPSGATTHCPYPFGVCVLLSFHSNTSVSHVTTMTQAKFTL